MVCTVRFGAPVARIDGEDKEAFLERARAAVIALSIRGGRMIEHLHNDSRASSSGCSAR